MSYINRTMVKVYAKMKSAFVCERGDTNFISIIIILAIVIVLAGVFIGFGQDIIDAVKGTIQGFTVPSFPTSSGP